jgi:hypothetical protein
MEPPDSCQEVTNTNAIQFLHSDQGWMFIGNAQTIGLLAVMQGDQI